MLKRELASDGYSELQRKTRKIWLTNTCNNNVEFLYFGKNGTPSLLKKGNSYISNQDLCTKIYIVGG